MGLNKGVIMSLDSSEQTRLDISLALIQQGHPPQLVVELAAPIVDFVFDYRAADMFGKISPKDTLPLKDIDHKDQANIL